METVNNIATAASRAIWGDAANANENQNQVKSDEIGGTEPVSGQLGNTKDGEPYDKGNVEPSTATSNTDANTSSTSGIESSSTAPQTQTSTEKLPSSTGNDDVTTGNTASTGPIRPEHDTEKTGVTSLHNPSSGFASDKPPTSSNDTSGPGANPSISADPTSTTQSIQKQQGADRPHAEPNSEEHKRILETKKEAEDAAKVDVSGPGPIPLEEKVKSGRSAASGGVGGDDGPQKHSSGEGTGEKYVKSTGQKADGGDFDAANPGAGKEADRILETKGVHREAPAKKDTSPDTKDSTTSGDTSHSKPSLKEKIKAKLHKH